MGIDVEIEMGGLVEVLTQQDSEVDYPFYYGATRETFFGYFAYSKGREIVRGAVVLC